MMNPTIHCCVVVQRPPSARAGFIGDPLDGVVKCHLFTITANGLINSKVSQPIPTMSMPTAMRLMLLEVEVIRQWDLINRPQAIKKSDNTYVSMVISMDTVV